MKKEDATKKFTGEWILLFNDKIVDHSFNIEDVLKTYDEKYPAEKFPDDEIKISKVINGTTRNF
jgi:transposase